MRVSPSFVLRKNDMQTPKNPLRDSEIPIALEDFLLKNFNIQEFVFSSLTLKLRFLVGLSTDVREVSALVCDHGQLHQSLRLMHG